MNTNNQNSKKRKKAYKVGILAEIISSIYLRLKGYKIIKRRYKNHYGEIDIIAFKKDCYSFIEVKFRQNIDDAYASIANYKQNRIIKSALFWQSQNFASHGKDLSFDIIALSPFKLPKHIKNAFSTNIRATHKKTL